MQNKPIKLKVTFLK